MDKYIFIDGVNGVGKTTLVNLLRENGYTNVYDGSILTKYSIYPVSELPTDLPTPESIAKQFGKIESMVDIISQINLEDVETEVSKNTNCQYIILDANIDICMERLEETSSVGNIDAIKYLRSKYLFMAYKYDIPVIDTSKMTAKSVFNISSGIIDEMITYVPDFSYNKMDSGSKFDLDILELEWLHLGDSRIIYVDKDYFVCRGINENYSINEYQQNIIKSLAKSNLSIFLHKIINN